MRLRQITERRPLILSGARGDHHLPIDTEGECMISARRPVCLGLFGQMSVLLPFLCQTVRPTPGGPQSIFWDSRRNPVNVAPPPLITALSEIVRASIAGLDVSG